MISEPAESDHVASAAVGRTSAGGQRRVAPATHNAYVLHSYDWSESSLIVELFTREAGRVVAAAKGAKRPTSQLRAVLMPFQSVIAQFARSKGPDSTEVRTLRSAEWGGGDAPALRGANWFAGFYLNELLLRLLARDDPHPRLFDAYAVTLRSLGGSETRSEAALRTFELLLLHETGVLPEFGRTTLTQVPLSPEGRYVLHAERGLLEAASGEASLPGQTWLELAGALDHWAAQAPEAGALEPLQSACLRERHTLKALLRSQLHYHLGGARLRTRQLLVETQRLLDTTHPPK
jgi:DNA repair protein RecO (recombination protein O)